MILKAFRLVSDTKETTWDFECESYEPEGREFESLRARHFPKISSYPSGCRLYLALNLGDLARTPGNFEIVEILQI